MRNDIDLQKSVVRLHLVNRKTYAHANGTEIAEGDYNGYRAVMRTGETRCFMALSPGDNSYDWLDVTADVGGGHFLVFERDITNLMPGETDDFYSELRRHGRSVHEFGISATPRQLDDQSGAISADRGTVTIRNRKSGAERTYDTGHASTWVVEFSDDLKSGVL
jgi:hypothetical protein